MKSFILPVAIAPMVIFASAGFADGDGRYTESYRNTSLQITTAYTMPIDVASSVTFASAIASTQGESCSSDQPETDDDMDPDIGGSPGVDASVTVSAEFGFSPSIAGAGVKIDLGWDVAELETNISVKTNVFNTRSSCPDACDPYGTGWVAATWVAAWPQAQSGTISGIDVTMDMGSGSRSYHFACTALAPGLTGVSTAPEIIRSDEFSSFTAEFFDVNGVSLGSETYQGVVFSDIIGDSGGSVNAYGALFSDPSPFLPACPFGEECIDIARSVSFAINPPSGTAYVNYNGEVANTSGFEYMDVNQDGVVDYFDRVEVAHSFGLGVDDLGYLPWADLTRDGQITSADGDILEAVNCIADLNGDGMVDTLDSGIYLGWYGSSDPAEQAKAELNGDGTLSYSDVTEFMTMLTTGCTGAGS